MATSWAVVLVYFYFFGTNSFIKKILKSDFFILKQIKINEKETNRENWSSNNDSKIIEGDG